MRNDKGFTLVEILVAMVIMTGATVALFQGVSLGGRGLDNASRQSHAVLLAKSLLAQAGVTEALEPGVRQGRTADGMEWTIAVAGQAEDDRRGAGGAQLKPYVVSVEVVWKERSFSSLRRVHLTTVKIGGAT